MVEFTGTPPTGKQLLSKLVELYAEQEGIKIEYEIEEAKEVEDIAS